MRATTSRLTNFKLADADVAVIFERNMLDGYQLLKDSLIIAKTPNVGKLSKMKVRLDWPNYWVKTRLRPHKSFKDSKSFK